MACSKEVNRLLFDLVGPKALKLATEEQLLQHIRLIVVRGLHKEVHRHRFHNMRQHEWEGLTQFLAKLQAQARFCNFTVQCLNESCRQVVNYSEDMVAGQLVAGLTNKEYQSKLLTEANILTTVEQKFHRLVSLETTDTSAPHLQDRLNHHSMFGSVRSEREQS